MPVNVVNNKTNRPNVLVEIKKKLHLTHLARFTLKFKFADFQIYTAGLSKLGPEGPVSCRV